MQFNPDPTKPATEVIFSQKQSKPTHPQIIFNNVPVSREDLVKHLGMTLDSKLNFRKHITEKIAVANKGISLLKFLAKYVSRETLSTLYKLHVRPHLDYGDIIYHDQLNESSTLLESVQYNAALVVSGCWKGTNRLKLYTELGWESLYNRRHCRRLCLFFKIVNRLSPSYLIYDPQSVREYPTHRYLRSFYPYCISHWFTLPNYLRQISNFPNFKRHLFHLYRPQKSLTYQIADIGLKFITRLRCDFSDLRDHRFRHNFNCPSPLCSCRAENKTTTHFLLKCQNYL